MNRTEQTLPSASQLEREAAYWLAQADRQGQWGQSPGTLGLDSYAESNSDFADWLQQDPSHRVAMLRLLHTWQRADRLKALGSPNAETASNSPRRWWLPVLPVAAALLLAIGAVLLNPTFQDYLDYRAESGAYETGIGVRKTIPLADGTTIELNTNTELQVRLSHSQRQVQLESGEAFFDVASDQQRPFSVASGRHRINVLGTQFSVYRQDEALRVQVLEGRVQLNQPGSTQTFLLEAGDTALARADQIDITHNSSAELKRQLSWRHGLLIFDQTALVDVVSEFNRYNQLQLSITDPELESMVISGSFKSNNVRAFMRLLKNGFGLKVESDGQIAGVAE